MINLVFCDSKFIISISTELTRVGQRFVTFVKKNAAKENYSLEKVYICLHR